VVVAVVGALHKGAAWAGGRVARRYGGRDLFVGGEEAFKPVQCFPAVCGCGMGMRFGSRGVAGEVGGNSFLIEDDSDGDKSFDVVVLTDDGSDAMLCVEIEEVEEAF